MYVYCDLLFHVMGGGAKFLAALRAACSSACGSMGAGGRNSPGTASGWPYTASADEALVPS